MHDLAILYAYCNIDGAGLNRETVIDFYNRLVRDNPGVPVVPLTCGQPLWVPGTVDVAQFETVWCTADETGHPRNVWKAHLWYHGDQVYWRYLRQPDRVEAHRYALFDWDTMSNGMSVQEFFGPLWNEDFATLGFIRYLNQPGWVWWREPAVRILGEQNAYGIVPVTGTLLSHRCVRVLAETIPIPEFRFLQCEFYIPALLNKYLGVVPVANTARRDMFGVYCDPPRRLSRGIHHPVKNMHATYWPHGSMNP